MLFLLFRVLFLFFYFLSTASLPTSISDSRTVSPALFQELEELSRIVDISYCVGSSGIQMPFQCLSRCSDFVGFELVTTWHTGPLLSDSCGYIALSHAPFQKRIILAFRGTYSITNTVVDLSTNPAEYVPFPADENSTSICTSSKPNAQQASTFSIFTTQNPLSKRNNPDEPECPNCTVHAGFLTSWTNTRCLLIPHLEQVIPAYPDYKLTLVGHSLGGAVAAIASLEFEARGWNPHVTTFGEPRIGNQALNDYIDRRFDLVSTEKKSSEERRGRGRRYRRVTHVHDPVPLLPLEEWDYRMHAGEIYISKRDLSPEADDLEHCVGDEDERCIAGPKSKSGSTSTNKEARSSSDSENAVHVQQLLNLLPHDLLSNVTRLNEYLDLDLLALLSSSSSSSGSSTTNDMENGVEIHEQTLWPSLPLPEISPRYRLWELFFAHRDYFWRLGLCVPGGDPRDWWRYPNPPENNEEEEGKRVDL